MYFLTHFAIYVLDSVMDKATIVKMAIPKTKVKMGIPQKIHLK